jgi:arginase family enzyme
MSRFAASRRVNLVGAPWCEGLNYAGVDLAPVALREAGLGEAVQGLGMDFQDCGDVDFSVVFKQACRSRKHQSRDSTDMYRRWLGSGSSVNFATWSRSQDGVGCSPGSKSPEAFPVEQRRHQGGIVNLDVMGPGLKLVHDAVARAAARDDFVLTVGGDHSIATGTVCALRAKHPELGVLWINAHADANTPRISPSGHYHGMAAAHLLGWFDKPGEVN